MIAFYFSSSTQIVLYTLCVYLEIYVCPKHYLPGLTDQAALGFLSAYANEEELPPIMLSTVTT